MNTTLFERVGGFARVRLMVSDFYQRVLDSSLLAPYFAEVEMRRLIDHQTQMFAALMGGPASISDDRLARVHAHLSITEEAFDEMAELFRETVEDHALDPAECERLHAHVLSLREHVVGGRGSPEGQASSAGSVARIEAVP
jgi:hemoglobin